MTTQYKKLFAIPNLNRDIMFSELSSLISLICNHEIEPSEIYFGLAWQPETGGFIADNVKASELIDYIKKTEIKKNELFGDNDVILTFSDSSVVVEYNHHACIFLYFNETNNLTDIIFENWKNCGLSYEERK